MNCLRELFLLAMNYFPLLPGISLHKGGFGFVQFKEEGEAEAAVKGEGGVFFKGCLLRK